MQGSQYYIGDAKPDELPAGGDIISEDDLRDKQVAHDFYAADQPERRYASVISTSWGDYVGDDYQRSNFEVLQERYPDTFIEVTGMYDSHRLVIPFERTLTIELVRDLNQLADPDQVPLLDEDAHFELLQQMLEEDLDGWIVDDLMSESRFEDSDRDKVKRMVRDFYTGNNTRDGAELRAEAATSIHFNTPDFMEFVKKYVCEHDVLYGECTVCIPDAETEDPRSPASYALEI